MGFLCLRHLAAALTFGSGVIENAPRTFSQGLKRTFQCSTYTRKLCLNRFKKQFNGLFESEMHNHSIIIIIINAKIETDKNASKKRGLGTVHPYVIEHGGLLLMGEKALVPKIIRAWNMSLKISLI